MPSSASQTLIHGRMGCDASTAKGRLAPESGTSHRLEDFILLVLDFFVEQASSLAPAQARTLVLRNNPHAGSITRGGQPGEAGQGRAASERRVTIAGAACRLTAV